MNPKFSSRNNTKKWMLAAGIAVALAGCGNDEDQAGDSNMIPEKVEALSNDQGDSNQSSSKDTSLQQSQQNGDVTKKDTDDIELTVPEEEDVDPELLASAQKKMDEGKEDELTIDEEIALSSAMQTTTNQEDQLEEQGTNKQELLTSGAAKLRSGQKISDAEEKVVEEYASVNDNSELLTLLQKFRHEKNGNKYDKKQITDSVGYGDTYTLYEKKHIKQDDKVYSAVHMPDDYYVDDMTIDIAEKTKSGAGSDMKLNEKETQKFIEQYLPKDANFLEFLEGIETSDYGDKHQFKFESKQSAKRLKDDGKITVDVFTSHYDKDGNEHQDTQFIDSINIRASHPNMHAQ